MKNITGDEDFATPIIFLFLFSMFSIACIFEIQENMQAHGSIILSKPVLFSDSILETLSNFCWFFIPASIFLAALSQKHLFLKAIYFLGTIPLALTDPLINLIGYKSLYVIKPLIAFSVAVCLMIYLLKTTELYQKALKEAKAECTQAASQEE